MAEQLPAYPATVLAGIRASEVDGRLPAPGAEQLGDIFPFESPVTTVPFDDATLPEPPRRDVTAEDCTACRLPDERFLWTSPTWRLRGPEQPFGLHAFFLEPRRHLDQDELTPELSGQLGPLMVRIERAITAAIDGVGRVHLCRWGDGGAHLHWWFLVRPAGLLQLRGSGLPLWLDVLPSLPEDVWRADLARVAAALR